MALIIEHTFTNGFPAVANEVNTNFSAVKTFVDALQTGTNIDAGAITSAKIADSSITQAKMADRAVGSSELDKITLNTQVGITYTPVLADAQKLITFDNPSQVTVTVPPLASVAFQKGDQINLLQIGDGQVVVTNGSGVTLNAQANKKKLNGKWAAATLIKVDDANTWVLIGNTAV